MRDTLWITKLIMLRFPLRPIGARHFATSPVLLLFKRAPLTPPAAPPTASSTAPTGSSAPTTPLNLATSQPPTPQPSYEKHPILKRIPKLLRPYTTQFINAPVSHVLAFVILHELTAIVPLVGIWYALHQYHDLFMLASLDLPAWAIEKGTKVIDKALQSWDFGNYSLNDKVKFITEGAYAYVIVKALFPIRIIFSLAGMPLFAKWFVLPITGLFKKKTTPPAQQPDVTKPHASKKVEKPRL